MKKNILKISILLIAAFMVNLMYLTYLQVFEGNKLLNHPRNRRLQLIEESFQRGTIFDAKGLALARTVEEGGKKKRVYPFGEMTGNITGYDSKRYGRSGLEASFNWALLGMKNDLAGFDFWSLKRFENNGRGNDLILTIDAKLQQLSYTLLGNRKGAVVAIEPSTGRILAMVSKPGFNPGLVDDLWQQLNTNVDSPLLNRAAQGLYPPGSAFKIITASASLAQKPENINRVFNAPGYITIEGRRIEDKQAQGRLNFKQAFAVSSNYVFASLGLEMGAESFIKAAEGFYINRQFPFDLPVAQSSIPKPQSLSKLELGESAIGQGRVMVTPLNMAMVTAGVANNGKIMAPTLVDQVRGPGGSSLWRFEPKILSVCTPETTAAQLQEIMAWTVTAGTGTLASIPGIKVGGKTGSAQNPHGQTHAWFVGFAPADNPKVAVAVIVENGGAGGREAAPIAREVFKAVIR